MLASVEDEMRKQFCGDQFDLCTIISGRACGCTEDCIYCTQSRHYVAAIAPSPVVESADTFR